MLPYLTTEKRSLSKGPVAPFFLVLMFFFVFLLDDFVLMEETLVCGWYTLINGPSKIHHSHSPFTPQSAIFMQSSRRSVLDLCKPYKNQPKYKIFSKLCELCCVPNAKLKKDELPKNKQTEPEMIVHSVVTYVCNLVLTKELSTGTVILL